MSYVGGLMLECVFVGFQIQQYLSAQDAAKKAHLGVWQYGDITEDDDKEFGLGR